jgi:hypothetical protein
MVLLHEKLHEQPSKARSKQVAALVSLIFSTVLLLATSLLLASNATFRTPAFLPATIKQDSPLHDHY